MNFKELGLNDELVVVCERLGWTAPTDIQRCSIPVALSGKDIIGKAETGGGKTGAFALPIINGWLNNSKPIMYALILTPTRELASQIEEQLILLGGDFGLTTNLLVGGDEMSEQILRLGKWESHIVIATPGRLVALLSKSKPARTMLETIRHLVIDEADRMLQLEFGPDVDTIIKYLPKRSTASNKRKLDKGTVMILRQTQLFSATFPKMIKTIANTILYNPEEVFVNNTLQIPKSLIQYCLVVEHTEKISTLFALLRHHLAKMKSDVVDDEVRSAIVFVSTCKQTRPLATFLNKMGASAVALHSQMSKSQREVAIEDFRIGSANILVATDIASRGIDVDHVKLVVNYELPQNPDWYKHRVGRTARVGRSGTAVTFVTAINRDQYIGMERRLEIGSLPVHGPLHISKQDRIKCQKCYTEVKKEEAARADKLQGLDSDFCNITSDNFTTKRMKITEKGGLKK